VSDIPHKNIYAFLKSVQKRPGMFVRDGNNLSDLTTMLHGYEIALRMHNIEESGSNFTQREFTDWLHRKTRIGGALGWAHIIQEIESESDAAFRKFFELVDEYKNQNTQNHNLKIR